MNMDIYDLMYALGDVSDRLVAETEKKSPLVKERAVIKWASLAACVCIVLAGTLFSVFYSNFTHIEPSQTSPSGTESGPADSVTAESMTLLTMPDKSEYLLGESLELEGLSFSVKYSDGTTETVSAGFDCGEDLLTTLGFYEVTVKYRGLEGTFKVTVTEPEVENLTLTKLPDRLEYYVHQMVDTSGIELKVTYVNGYERTITEGFGISAYNADSPGIKSFAAMYGGKIATFEVTYKDYDVSELTISTEASKTTYYVGDTIDITGLTLTAVHNDGTVETVTDGFDITPNRFTLPGPLTVMIYYGGAYAAYNVTVEIKQTDEPLSSGRCGDLLEWRLDYDGTLTITGMGDMSDGAWDDEKYAVKDIPWIDDMEIIRRVVVDDGVTSIGDYAFYECYNLTEITLPEGITSIGDSAFYYTDISKIDLPESVTKIGVRSFNGCGSITEIEIPVGVTEIGDGTFDNCIKLSHVTLPEGITSIGEQAFQSCSSLSSLTIPASVTDIGKEAFNYCESLTEITLPEGITSIEGGLFRHCTALESVTLPKSTLYIGWEAFAECPYLSDITIPDDVTLIDRSAFLGCKRLRSVTLPESVTMVNYSAFSACDALTDIYIENAECDIYAVADTLGSPQTTVIHGRAGSTAEEYANEYGYKFAAIN